jgi:arsenate reductase
MESFIYHNPRCSKSRQTLKIVEEAGTQLKVIEYLKEPPSAKELERLCTMLGVEPNDLIRWRESRLKEIGVTKRDRRSRSEWLTILSENPILIERPIVVVDGKAILGRPPSNVLEIL